MMSSQIKSLTPTSCYLCLSFVEKKELDPMGVMKQVSHYMSSQFEGVENARPSSQLWVGILAKCPQNIGLGEIIL